MTTILAIHGLLDSPRGFAPLEEELLEVEFLAPRVPQNRTTLSGRILWLKEWAKKRDLRDFHLLGHSLGGAVVAGAAADLQPHSLMLLAPAGFGKLPLAEALRGNILRHPLRWSAPRLIGVSPLVRTTYRHLFSAGGEMPADLQKELQRDPQAVMRRAEREMEIVAEASRHPLADSKYDGPVFALWGERDRLVPWREGSDVLRVFPDADIKQLPGIGHDLLREDSEALSHWIRDCLQNASSGKGKQIR